MNFLNRYKLIIMCLVMATGWSNTVSAQIIISEIMYDPCTLGNMQGTDQDCEYIEIFNSYTTSYDLCGVTFTGVVYRFPCPTIIPSGGYIVVARTNSMCNAAPAGPEDYDLTGIPNVWTGGGLGNNGETVSLSNCEGVEIASATFLDIVNNASCQSVTFDGAGIATAETPTPGTGTLLVGNTPAPTIPDCEITNVMASATCNGDDVAVVTTWIEGNTNGTVEVDVNGLGFMTITSGGTYLITGPTAAATVTVTVRDACCMETTTVAIPACPAVATCEVTDIVLDTQTPTCNGDGTYTVTLTTTGGPDASVSYTDANATIAGADPAVTANAVTTFTYPIGTSANIAVNDSESNCSFGPFTATSPAADTGINYMETDGIGL